MSEPFYHCERDEPSEFCKEDVHEWIGLSYASYLSIPRSLLQEMPADWQHELVRLLDQMGARFQAPLEGHYAVLLRGDHGRFIGDPLRNYRYPSRHHIQLATKEQP